jgi:Transposase DDE domain group 1
MPNDTRLPVSLPAIGGKKVTATFDGGTLSSDGGVLLLAAAEERLGLLETLAGLIPDQRDPTRITHPVADILRARVFAIACGYPDADDLDALRHDPAFKLACGRLPESGADLASQPTLSRLENTPNKRTLLRLGHAMIDLWCQSHARKPRAITLDIDDTLDVVHGHQPSSLFNAHHDERCFLPIHVYDAASGHCVATILRPGKTPDGREVRGHLRCLIRRIRLHWPNTRITIRGDSHYARPEAMAWCEANDVQYLFGLSTNAVLAAAIEPAADAVRVCRAVADLDRVRDYAETPYAAGSWPRARRVVARIKATRLGLDVRYVVTNITHLAPHWLYASLYCARGRAENLIKRHKAQLASDRTSCRSPLANQMRLILHTAAYWLMRLIAQAIPPPQPLARAEFTTIRSCLLKVAVRVRESASRVHLAFATNYPEAVLFRGLLRGLLPRPT